MQELFDGPFLESFGSNDPVYQMKTTCSLIAVAVFVILLIEPQSELREGQRLSLFERVCLCGSLGLFVYGFFFWHDSGINHVRPMEVRWLSQWWDGVMLGFVPMWCFFISWLRRPSVEETTHVPKMVWPPLPFETVVQPITTPAQEVQINPVAKQVCNLEID